MQISASRFSSATVWCTASIPPSTLCGWHRAVPSMVPPSTRMPLTSSLVSGTASPLITPSQPLWKPTIDIPCSAVPRITIARMAAFKPGQSPPPVRIPTRMAPTLVSGRPPIRTLTDIDVEGDGKVSGCVHLINQNGLNSKLFSWCDFDHKFIVHLQQLAGRKTLVLECRVHTQHGLLNKVC